MDILVIYIIFLNNKGYSNLFEEIRDSIYFVKKEKIKRIKNYEKISISSPLLSLKKVESQKFMNLLELKQKWLNEAFINNEDLSDFEIYRNFLSKKFNIDETIHTLKNILEWKKKTNPNKIKLEDLNEIGKSNFIINDGYDRYSRYFNSKNRPILYIIYERDKFLNNEENKNIKFLYLCYNIERCLAKMNENVYNITFIINLKNANIDMNTINQLKDLFSKLGNYYSECMGKICFKLGKCIIVNR
jgi:hypothetical protein